MKNTPLPPPPMEGLLGGYRTIGRECTNVLGVNLLGFRLGGLVGKSLAPPLALSLKSKVSSRVLSLKSTLALSVTFSKV